MILSSSAALFGIVSVVAGVGMTKQYPLASQAIYGIGLVIACLGSLALGMDLVDAGYITFHPEQQ